MQRFSIVILLSLGSTAGASLLRSRQEPDTSCGKGFDNLVDDSKAYMASAAKALWNHPYHLADYATMSKEFECWFAFMSTTKCGNIPSQADTRKEKLNKLCTAPNAEFLPVWNEFSKEEVKWFKTNYPSSAAMQTAKRLNMKETLCLTLYAIDDECVKWPYIRMGQDLDTSKRTATSFLQVGAEPKEHYFDRRDPTDRQLKEIDDEIHAAEADFVKDLQAQKPASSLKEEKPEKDADEADEIEYDKKQFAKDWASEWKNGDYPSYKETYSKDSFPGRKAVVEAEDTQSDGKPSTGLTGPNVGAYLKHDSSDGSISR